MTERSGPLQPLGPIVERVAKRAVAKRLLKVYYVSNIDGRNCGMIAVRSKKEVRDVVRVPPSEIEADCLGGREELIALSEPGRLWFHRIAGNDPWQAHDRKHPDYVEKPDV